nr:PAS domain-containing sensor histidine kinase [Aestuariispira insulae]
MERVFSFILLGLAAASGVATYAVLTSSDLNASPQEIMSLISLDLVLLLMLGILVIRKIVSIWSARRRGSAGAQLHVRLVVMFGALSVAPTIVVSVFSLLFFDLGLESWFSDRVRTALSESQAVAEAYLKEHQKNVQSDALRIARGISRDAFQLENDTNKLHAALNIHSQLRGIHEALIFNPDAGVIARSGLTLVLELEPIPQEAIKDARDGEVVLLEASQDDRVRALVRLDNFLQERFLLVGRYVDSTVLSRTEQTRTAVAQFERLEGERSGIKVIFLLAFIVVALLLLLGSVWIGLIFASRLTQPISELIAATEKVRGGDLNTRVPELAATDELGVLSRAFNRMTSQLESQRGELLDAAQQIDERRRFSEAVLTGVSAGVIGLDAKGRIDLPNRSASILLGIDLEELTGHELSAVVPELSEVINQAQKLRGGKHVEEEVKVEREGETTTLFVRISKESSQGKLSGFVVTFDDMSDLLAAQRKAAWADVARRIAHEIKNPLTPIQLSAERLKRKYLKQIQTDPETFQGCVDTIIRQVDDIERMVTEFSSFARMPKPTIQRQNLSDICRQAVFLQKNANTHIRYETEIPEGALYLDCDSRQISQVVVNLLQNAHDAIVGRQDDAGTAYQGNITLRLRQDADKILVEVIDNGKGLPQEGRDRLTEPYVTTRKKGTGLGLAIVKKIMEDHQGGLILEDAQGPEGGAHVTLYFNRRQETEPGPEEQESKEKLSHGS